MAKTDEELAEALRVPVESVRRMAPAARARFEQLAEVGELLRAGKKVPGTIVLSERRRRK